MKCNLDQSIRIYIFKLKVGFASLLNSNLAQIYLNFVMECKFK